LPTNYTLSLHDALPIFQTRISARPQRTSFGPNSMGAGSFPLLRIRQSSRSETCNLLASSWIVTSQASAPSDHLSKSVSVILIERSEEHTSELQSPCNLV